MEEAAERRLLLTLFANGYSAYFKSDEISLELLKLQEYVQETIVKLEELQSLFEMKESEDNDYLSLIVPSILRQNRDAYELFQRRLQQLDTLVKSYKRVLDELEVQVIQAEQAFGLNSSFRNVLSLFKRQSGPAAMMHSLNSSKFVPVIPVDLRTCFNEL